MVFGQEHGKYSGEIRRPEEGRIVNSTQLKELETIGLNKIRDAAKENRLFNTPNLKHILAFWIELSGNEGEVRKWVTELIATDDNLARFIYYFGNYERSQTIGDIAVKERFRLDPEWIKPYVDPEMIYPRIQNILKQNNIEEEYKKALVQFCQEYEMRKRGENPNNRI